MSWLEYFKFVNLEPPFPTTHQLGYGADGQVFAMPNQNDRVWKLSLVHKETKAACQEEVKRTIQNYEWIMSNEHPNIAKVYDVDYIASGERDTGYYLRHFAMFYSIIEKLEDFTVDEFKVISSLLQAEYASLTSLRNFPTVLNELRTFLTFDYDKVMEFQQFLLDCPIRHNDLGISMNVMKDSHGNFKLIDFDRIEIRNI